LDLIKGTDYYINEDGLYVFTAQYLLKRGYCCGNGCKHCPYTEESETEAEASDELPKENDL